MKPAGIPGAGCIHASGRLMHSDARCQKLILTLFVLPDPTAFCAAFCIMYIQKLSYLQHLQCGALSALGQLYRSVPRLLLCDMTQHGLCAELRKDKNLRMPGQGVTPGPIGAYGGAYKVCLRLHD